MMDEHETMKYIGKSRREYYRDIYKIKFHSLIDFLVTSVGIVGLYVAGLYCFQNFYVKGTKSAKGNYWKTNNNRWDGPEPNYMVVPWIAEFWCVVTMFPIAGLNLVRLAVKYGYDWPVLFVSVCVTLMSTCAMTSHLTLSHSNFIVTVCSATFIACFGFAMWSSVLCRLFKSAWIRYPLAICMWSLLVKVALVLPKHPNLKPHAGLTSLFMLQTPVAVLGFVVAFYCLMTCSSKNAGISDAFWFLTFGGGCLVGASAMSFLEILWGYENGYLAAKYLGFPWMHVSVHILEQIGIYLCGVGAAALHHTVVKPIGGCSIFYAAGIPYTVLPPKIDSKVDVNPEQPRRSPRLAKTD